MDRKRILWVDDEIEQLRPHIILLREKGYQVETASNGEDAMDMVTGGGYDIILLDQMMPGADGLTTLERIREVNPIVPVVLVTKSEEEELMEEAIGKEVSDFLTKPVNPSQVLSVCKRIIEGRRIVESKMPQEYVAQSSQLRNLLLSGPHWKDWIEIHRILSEWDLKLDGYQEAGLEQAQRDQRREFNLEFGKYIEAWYPRWLRDEDPPPLSVDLVANYLYPLLASKRQTFFIVVDCMRLDQWLKIEPLLTDYFDVKRDYYYSIIPTATPYSRNAIFSGLFPSEIVQFYPRLWSEGADEERSRNRYEKELLDNQLGRMGLKFKLEPKYVKVVKASEGEELVQRISSFAQIPLVSLVFNFLDLLTHGRSESELLKELASDESAFRSVMRSWFEHSSLFEILRFISRRDSVVVLTTDHGSILGNRGTKAYGKKDTSTNLRYKYGDNLNCDRREAILIRDPADYKLPKLNISTNYIVAKEDYYFVYPTRYHEYLNRYRNSFQHGGVSLEEMILPVVTLNPR